MKKVPKSYDYYFETSEFPKSTDLNAEATIFGKIDAIFTLLCLNFQKVPKKI